MSMPTAFIYLGLTPLIQLRKRQFYFSLNESSMCDLYESKILVPDRFSALAFSLIRGIRVCEWNFSLDWRAEEALRRSFVESWVICYPPVRFKLPTEDTTPIANPGRVTREKSTTTNVVSPHFREASNLAFSFILSPSTVIWIVEILYAASPSPTH
jgi:hypothetical protein